ncbi:MAG: CDP-archaeol synthase [Candidatus Altimarinota bacterium]
MEIPEYKGVWDLLVITFVIMWPAYLANMFPVLWSKVPGVKKLFVIPLDAGKKLGKNRILGDHKTLGGLISAVIGGMIGGVMIFLPALIGNFFLESLGWSLWVGGVLGFGAIMGDVLKSFFKRRMAIASGKSWPFFDQVDFVIGAWVASWFITGFDKAFAFEFGTWIFFVTALIITPLLHLLSNIVAYKLGLKKVWW